MLIAGCIVGESLGWDFVEYREGPSLTNSSVAITVHYHRALDNAIVEMIQMIKMIFSVFGIRAMSPNIGI